MSNGAFLGDDVIDDVVTQAEGMAASRTRPAVNEEGARYLRELLDAVAHNVQSGEVQDDEDRAWAISTGLGDLASVPPRVADQIKVAAADVVTRVEAGDRQGALNLSRERAAVISADLPKRWERPPVDRESLGAALDGLVPGVG